MSLRAPLGRALGTGSAKEGASHWWLQRVTSVALVPLTLWFAIALTSLGSLGYASVSAWLGAPLNAVLMILLLLVLAWHSKLGVQVVIEDYVHGKSLKVASLMLSACAHFAVAAAGVFSVLRIAFGSLA
jgi:succinate dehydrogenase / fumarate reductase, membrane anchor subunit